MTTKKNITFNNLKLEKPLFYKCNIGIRFEIGPENISTCAESNIDILNENYFEAALERATTIFNTAFDANDNISIVYQVYSPARQRIHPTNFLFKQIREIQSKSICFSKHRDIYPDIFYTKKSCWRRVTISDLKVSDVNVVNILESFINTDFNIRKPSLPGECFIINHQKNIILNLYDDRGMDVVANSIKTLSPLYVKHNAWILDYDRQEIDTLFKEYKL